MIKIKDGEVRPERCMGELNFGYNAKTVVYTNSSSDIPKLDEIVARSEFKQNSLLTTINEQR